MRKWCISKEFHFSASHQLRGLPPEHQCARMHGHNYILTVRLSGEKLRHPGFILDYGDLGFVKKMVDAMDHRHLNDLFPFNPTSELIIEELYALIWVELKPMIERGQNIQLEVGLSETPKTWAWFTKEN